MLLKVGRHAVSIIKQVICGMVINLPRHACNIASSSGCWSSCR